MLKDLLLSCRSCRGYDESRRVSREELLKLVDLTRYSASSMNIQPLKYFLIWEKEDVDRMQPLTGWAKQLPQMSLPHPGKCPTAFIVICQDTAVSPAQNAFIRDVGIAAQTILLGATENGLGGCMIGSFNPARVSEEFSLPAHIRPMLVVAIGKPDEKIVLTGIPADGNYKYYRDENDVHYVPKRSLEEIVLS